MTVVAGFLLGVVGRFDYRRKAPSTSLRVATSSDEFVFPIHNGIFGYSPSRKGHETGHYDSYHE